MLSFICFACDYASAPTLRYPDIINSRFITFACPSCYIFLGVHYLEYINKFFFSIRSIICFFLFFGVRDSTFPFPFIWFPSIARVSMLKSSKIITLIGLCSWVSNLSFRYLYISSCISWLLGATYRVMIYSLSLLKSSLNSNIYRLMLSTLDIWFFHLFSIIIPTPDHFCLYLSTVD